MATPNFWDMLGYTNNALIFQEAFSSASNVFVTDNPPYTRENFLKLFPKFLIGDVGLCVEENYLPNYVFNMFMHMADKALKYKRYGSQWEYFMGLYIAHFATLYFQATQGDAGSSAALASAAPSGVATSKSVDGLSISYDLLGVSDDLAGYGTWKLTAFGQQLATLTKMYGAAGMWVNG